MALRGILPSLPACRGPSVPSLQLHHPGLCLCLAWLLPGDLSKVPSSHGAPTHWLRAISSPSLTAHTCRYPTPASCSDHRYVLKLSLEHIILGDTICLTQTIATMRVVDVWHCPPSQCVCSCRAQRQAWDRVRTLRSSVLHIHCLGPPVMEVCGICRAGCPSLNCQLPGAGGQGSQ